MAYTLIFRHGLSSARVGFTPPLGEPLFDTDTKRVYVGNGAEVGGIYIGGGNKPQVFVPAGDSRHAHKGFAGDGVAKLQLANNYPSIDFEEVEIQVGAFSFKVPTDYGGNGTLKVIYIDTGTGGSMTVVLSVQLNARLINATYNQGNYVDLDNVLTMTNNDKLTAWTASDLNAIYIADAYVGVKLTREVGHVSDSFPTSFKVAGILFEYTR